jgi:hypothetical protein
MELQLQRAARVSKGRDVWRQRAARSVKQKYPLSPLPKPLGRPRMAQMCALRQCVCSVLIRLTDSDDARPGRWLPPPATRGRAFAARCCIERARVVIALQLLRRGGGSYVHECNCRYILRQLGYNHSWPPPPPPHNTVFRRL